MIKFYYFQFIFYWKFIFPILLYNKFFFVAVLKPNNTKIHCMKRHFTLNDLFLYYYNELPEDEVQAFESHLKFDSILQEAYHALIETSKLLDTQKAKPSDASIRLILDYNRQNSSELEAI